MAGLGKRIKHGARTYADLVTGKTLARSKNILNTLQDDLSSMTFDTHMKEGAYTASREAMKQTAKAYPKHKFDHTSKKMLRDDFRDMMNTARTENFYRDLVNHQKHLHDTVAKKTRNARIGVGVAGVGALGAGAYGLKKLSNKNKAEKTAFDIVEESFEKIAYELDEM